MSYPKVPPKPSLGPVTKISEQRRERLLKLQEREELKGLLVSKFKAKYGKESTFIEREVDNFIKNETLTEANLRKLDDRIKNQGGPVPPKRASSVKSASNRSAASARSKASAISRQSQKSQKGNPVEQQPNGSEFGFRDDLSSDSRSMRSSSYVPENDEDEWAAIIEHDTAAFYEEEQARRRREMENKQKMKRELDRQLAEKNMKMQREEQEGKRYEAAQTRNIELQARREREREEEYKQKVLQEKQLRDRQLADEKRRKKMESRQQREMDGQLVRRLQEELMNEQKNFEDKRKDERAYMQRMMRENEEQKQKVVAMQASEHHNDVKTQQDYARMLDQLEQDRLHELQKREERQQQLMARMADGVLKEQNLKSKEEDLMLLRQIEEREELDRMEDERRMEIQRRQKMNTREYLDSQVQDKARRKEMERQTQIEQAEIWKRDTEEFQHSEEERRQREKTINLANAEALKLQMIERNKKKSRPIMSAAEAALNRQTLKAVRQERSQAV
jgi:hypothetical protein